MVISNVGASPRLSSVLKPVWFVLAAALAAGACERAPLDVEPTPSTDRIAASQVGVRVGPDGGLLTRPEPLERTPALKVDLPEAARALDTDPGALVSAVQEQDGRVFIGLKPAAAAHTLETGVVPATTRDEVLEAHQMLEAHGVKIERTYASFPVVFAIVAPEATPELRKLSTVNYIEPAVPLTLASLRIGQDTSWGVFKVHAPQGWLYTRRSPSSTAG